MVSRNTIWGLNLLLGLATSRRQLLIYLIDSEPFQNALGRNWQLVCLQQEERLANLVSAKSAAFTTIYNRSGHHFSSSSTGDNCQF
jgi:hypothetical protein